MRYLTTAAYLAHVQQVHLRLIHAEARFQQARQRLAMLREPLVRQRQVSRMLRAALDCHRLHAYLDALLHDWQN